MSTNEAERKAYVKQEICSVATEFMDIEPEDDYSRNVVYCLKHKYLTKNEYWLAKASFDAKDVKHEGIRIHKVKSNSVPRRNFVDLFTSVNTFNDGQARYIAKTVAYLIECVAPTEQDVADTILAHYAHQHKSYCFNYYTSVSHENHFYVVDGFIKFEGQPLCEHLKLSFEVYRDGFPIHRDIHFYAYGDELICSARTSDGNHIVVNRNEDHKVLACKILKSMILPLLSHLDSVADDINPENIKSFFDNIPKYQELTAMVTI